MVVDQEQWSDDAVEFVQKKVDPLEDFQSGHAAITNFLVSLVKDRSKSTFLPTIKFVNDILSSCVIPQHSSVPIDQIRGKDGAMAMLVALGPSILSKAGIREQASDVLVTFIFPELDSNVPFIRIRVCQVIQAFCQHDEDEVIFPDQAAEGETLKYPEGWNSVVPRILAYLRNEEELPIRVYAALALEALVEKDGVREHLRPHIAYIMQGILFYVIIIS